MKISIITFTYNRKKKIQNTINSVLNQSYTNWEYYVVDDGSDDNTKDLFIEKKYKDIKYINLPNNSGQGGAFINSNILNIISGDIVIILDSDDWLAEGALEKIVYDFKSFHKDVWCIAYNWYPDNDIKQFNKIDNYNKFQTFNSFDIFNDDYPLNSNNNGYRDYLFVCRKEYWNARLKYFTLDKHLYTSQYDVAMNNIYIVKFTELKIYYMGFDDDCVTKGMNFNKYSPITNFTREYLFKNYKDKMSNKYFQYTIKSLILNYYIYSGNKIKILKLIKLECIELIKKLNNILLYAALFILPTRLILYLKKFIKNKRNKR